MIALDHLAQLPAGKWRLFTIDPGNAIFCYRQRLGVTLYFVAVPLTQYTASDMISVAEATR